MMTKVFHRFFVQNGSSPLKSTQSMLELQIRCCQARQSRDHNNITRWILEIQIHCYQAPLSQGQLLYVLQHQFQGPAKIFEIRNVQDNEQFCMNNIVIQHHFSLHGIILGQIWNSSRIFTKFYHLKIARKQ